MSPRYRILVAGILILSSLLAGCVVYEPGPRTARWCYYHPGAC